MGLQAKLCAVGRQHHCGHPRRGWAAKISSSLVLPRTRSWALGCWFRSQSGDSVVTALPIRAFSLFILPLGRQAAKFVHAEERISVPPILSPQIFSNITAKLDRQCLDYLSFLTNALELVWTRPDHHSSDQQSGFQFVQTQCILQPCATAWCKSH